MPTHQEKAAKKLQSFYNNGKSTDLLHYNLEKIAKHPEGNQTLTLEDVEPFIGRFLDGYKALLKDYLLIQSAPSGEDDIVKKLNKDAFEDKLKQKKKIYEICFYLGDIPDSLIISTIETGLKLSENPDKIYSETSKKKYTFKETVEEIKKHTDLGNQLLFEWKEDRMMNLANELGEKYTPKNIFKK